MNIHPTDVEDMSLVSRFCRRFQTIQFPLLFAPAELPNYLLMHQSSRHYPRIPRRAKPSIHCRPNPPNHSMSWVYIIDQDRFPNLFSCPRQKALGWYHPCPCDDCWDYPNPHANFAHYVVDWLVVPLPCRLPDRQFSTTWEQ